MKLCVKARRKGSVALMQKKGFPAADLPAGFSQL
jgi:hypothetical protein